MKETSTSVIIHFEMINKSKILITGGSGLLGSELKNLYKGAQFPTSKELDVSSFESVQKYFNENEIELVIHAAAFTSPPECEKSPEIPLSVNVLGTGYLTTLCMEQDIKLVYVSTDYVFRGDKGGYKEDDAVHPVNKYAWSKLGGECAVRMYDNSLIIRTSFGPKLFPYEKAYVDQWTSKETVDKIAAKIKVLVDAEATGVYHLGGPRITRYEYAKSLPNGDEIGKLSINDVTYVAPKDNSLDVTKFNNLINSVKMEENK